MVNILLYSRKPHPYVERIEGQNFVFDRAVVEMEPLPEFQYEPFDHRAGTSIRLLQISAHSGSATPALKCKLEAWIRQEAPPYAAISYTWGDLSRPQTILANGALLRITDNAYFALRQVVSQQRVDYVWMDSICINQANDEEKSQQVAMMSLIYQSAAVVFACIGPHADKSPFVMRVLHHLHDMLVNGEDRGSQVDLWSNPVIGPRLYMYIDCKSKMIVCAPAALRYFIRALRHFAHRRFWTRRWIFQELWFAKEAYILCGTDSVRLEVATGASERLLYPRLCEYFASKWDTDDIDLLRSIEATPMFGILRPLNLQAVPRLRLPILDLLQYLQRCDCSNFRDAIFALRQVSEWPGSAPRIDYRFGKVELMTEFLDKLGKIVLKDDEKHIPSHVIGILLKNINLHSNNIEIRPTADRTILAMDSDARHWIRGCSAWRLTTHALSSDFSTTLVQPHAHTLLHQEYTRKNSALHPDRFQNPDSGLKILDSTGKLAGLACENARSSDVLLRLDISWCLGLIVRLVHQYRYSIIGYALIDRPSSWKEPDWMFTHHACSIDYLYWHVYNVGVEGKQWPKELVDRLLTAKATQSEWSSYCTGPDGPKPDESKYDLFRECKDGQHTFFCACD